MTEWSFPWPTKQSRVAVVNVMSGQYHNHCGDPQLKPMVEKHQTGSETDCALPAFHPTRPQNRWKLPHLTKTAFVKTPGHRCKYLIQYSKANIHL